MNASVRKLSGRRLLLLLLGLLILTVVPAVVAPTLLCRPEPPKLDDLGTVPPFSLVDHLDRAATADAMRGHVTIVNFIFTRCEAVCPVSSMKMQRIQEQTADLGAKVKLISISVDPEYDTPQRLNAYGHKFSVDPTRWRMLTGPAQDVRTLVEGPFMTSMMAMGTTPSGAPDIVHKAHFFLVDAHLRIRGAYDSNEVTRLETLMRHARYLARLGS